MFVTNFECKYRDYFVTFKINYWLLHEIVGLMYEFCFAVWAMGVLSHKIVWLVTHGMLASGAHIVTLKLAGQLQAFLWHLRRVEICLDEENH